jgi:M6 family metalloprotease-like protein
MFICKLVRVCLGILMAATVWQPGVVRHCLASPFSKQFRFTQPDGTAIRLWGRGDEFSAVFETLEGYTVTFVPEARAYCYARLSTDGSVLESTGALVGRTDPATLALPKHLRTNAESDRQAAHAQRAAWERSVSLSERWSELKLHNLRSRPVPLAPPSFTTTGVKCGLTVLIDFEDARASIPRDVVCGFLNGDSFTGFGNNGSVKQYFADTSNGRLLFTNAVTLYVTIPNSVHPRSYYNDPTKNCFVTCRELVRDALNVMKALPNFTNDFRPLFEAVTVDSQKKVISANFFVAGGDSGVWAKGIWGQVSLLSYSVGQQYLWPGGKIIDAYNLTPMGEELGLYTFCHETGHLLCGFPDLYDYGYDAYGGAGDFCIMCGYGSITNPVQFSAYLKAAAGWATVVDLRSGTNFLASLSASGPDFNRFFRFRKTGTTTEYFLLENRQKTGHDAWIPGSGIAVWHVDELGNRDNQSLQTNSNHLNYELTLEQADNRWDYQLWVNVNHTEDLYYDGNPSPGYANGFSDLTSPSAQWWNGLRSGLALSDFSTNGPTMTFRAQIEPVVVRFDPVRLTVFETQPASFSFSYSGVLTPSIQWYKDGGPLAATETLTGVNSTRLAITAAALADAGDYWAVITHSTGSATTRVAHLTVQAPPLLLSTNYRSTGTTILAPDGIELSATGTGIAGTSDSCRFAYQRLSGDFDVRVFLLGINMKGTESRAGLMVRKSEAVDSPHLSLLSGLTPEGRPCSIRTRPTQGDSTQELLGFLAPVVTNWQRWQRIQRVGNRLTCYLSENGSDWTWLNSHELDLDSDAFVGVGLFAGPGQTESAYAWFRHYEVRTNFPTSLAIFAADPTAQEGTLERAELAVYSSRNGPLHVPVSFGGTAVAGRDYLPLASTVFIPEGTNVGLIPIQAINDALPSAPKAIEVSLAQSPEFECVQPTKANALILDDEQVIGGVIRQLYSGIGGWAVADLTRQITNLNALTEVSGLSSFEAPTNNLNYGQILSGYLVPPESGEYVFYLASDENSELWLSTDSDPANLSRVANVAGYARFRDYLAAGNHSAPITLEQGKYYYVRALHKQGWGADCLSLAWQTPGGSAPTNGSAPIEGAFLAYSLPPAGDLNLTPQAASFSALPGTGSVAITCPGTWSAESLDTWIVLSGETSGTGSGEVRYQVAANTTGSLRAGTIVVNGRIHSVIQAAPPGLAIACTEDHTLTVSFDTSALVVLEASSDLHSWLPIWTNSAPGKLPLTQIDPISQTATNRFYRALMQ